MKKIKKGPHKGLYEAKGEELRPVVIQDLSQEVLEKTLQFAKDTIADCESGKLPSPEGFLEGVRVTLKKLEDELERRRLS